MDIHSQLDAISRLRAGSVLTPDEVQHQARTLVQMPRLDGYGLFARAPNWLVSQFEAARSAPEQATVVLAAPGTQDNVLVLTLQCASTQLRLLMRLGDERIQQYLRDCIRRERILLLLQPENTRQMSALTLNGGFTDAELIQRLLRESSTCDEGVRNFVKLSWALTSVDAFRSIVDAQPVTDVITVAITDAKTLLGAAMTPAPADGASLH